MLTWSKVINLPGWTEALPACFFWETVLGGVWRPCSEPKPPSSEQLLSALSFYAWRPKEKIIRSSPAPAPLLDLQNKKSKEKTKVLTVRHGGGEPPVVLQLFQSNPRGKNGDKFNWEQHSHQIYQQFWMFGTINSTLHLSLRCMCLIRPWSVCYNFLYEFDESDFTWGI